ncbi:hypothetical protein [Haloferula sp.]|uniref:hypothetical protein n=1 Tax=Haloferula sp. TaxID=2497595 RepID=UPI00329F4060
MSSDDAEEFFEIEEEDEDEALERERLSTAIAQLRDRIDGTKYALSEEPSDIDDDDEFVFTIPAGRDTKEISLWDAEDTEALLAIDFENYARLPAHLGIVSYKHDTIEVVITPGTTGMPFFWRRIATDLTTEDLRRLTPGRDFLTVDNGGRQIAVGTASKQLMVLSGRGAFVLRRQGAIRLSGFGVTTQSDATRILDTYAYPLLFQLDQSHGITLTILRDTRPMRGRGRPRKTEEIDLEFPSHTYDSAPLSLYFYGRRARNLPLLQFLAYYQVVEYYFPAYSRAEAQRRIRTVIKDPAFRADRDADVARILSVITASRGNSFGDERSQLRSTLKECLIEEELRTFLATNKERAEFLSTKGALQNIGAIPVKSPSSDIIAEVAGRVYDVRCRIVHTKGTGDEGEVELLLPYSKEADQLYFDIELVEYIAQRVLISGSSHIH